MKSKSKSENREPDKVERFKEERERLNELVMFYANRDIKRYYALDGASYRAGAIDAKTKELMGLVASLALRCDDCVTYHVNRAFEEGASDAEIIETLQIGLVVGGSITIPHLRRAIETWDVLKSRKETDESGR